MVRIGALGSTVITIIRICSPAALERLDSGDSFNHRLRKYYFFHTHLPHYGTISVERDRLSPVSAHFFFVLREGSRFPV